MRILFNLVASLFGNAGGQRLLEAFTKIILGLQGIGTGAGVNKSGERLAIANLLKIRNQDSITIIDVGANKGQFLEMATEILAASGTRAFSIHSFEPSQSTFKLLQASSGKNSHAKLNNFGLGSSVKMSTLYSDAPGSGLASQSKRDLRFLDREMGYEESINIQTLDGYCSENAIRKVDLLKIDVEGFEMDVLQGATRMLENAGIRQITFEFGGCNIDTKSYFKDFFYFFDQKGFDIFRITPSGYLAHLKQYKEIYEQFRTTNFVAIPRSES